MSADTWKDEALVERLKSLHADGLSASQIGNRLGVSRSAVIGKIHRLGLAKGHGCYPRLTARNMLNARLARRPRRQRAEIGWKKPPHEIFAEREAARQAPELFIPEHERKTLETLEPADCRYPYGDPRTPDFYFCGKPRVGGLPYCDWHRKIAFVPVTSRRERAELAAQQSQPAEQPASEPSKAMEAA